MDLGISGRVLVITGASGGIGRSVALELAKEGAAIAIGARRADELEAVATVARDLGCNVATSVGDLTTQQGVDQLVESAIKAFGRIDGVAACVGSTPIGTVEELTDEVWRSAFETKFLASLRIFMACLPSLRQRGGRAVFLAGNAWRAPSAHMSTSGAINAALSNLAATLSLQYAPEKVGVCCVDPGPVSTGRLTAMLDYRSRSTSTTPDQEKQALLRAIPDGRVASPDEIGALVAYLLSPLASHIVATSLVIDGGQSTGISQ